MLGDTGANALGAGAGLGIVADGTRRLVGVGRRAGRAQL